MKKKKEKESGLGTDSSKSANLEKEIMRGRRCVPHARERMLMASAGGLPRDDEE